MVANTVSRLTVLARDLSGQRQIRVSNVSADGSVNELIDDLVPRLNLVDRVEGRPITYQARHQREGRLLHGAERVGDALQESDMVVLAPSIDAG